MNVKDMIVVDLIGVSEKKVRDIVLSLVNEIPEIRFRVLEKTISHTVGCFGGKFFRDKSEEIYCVPGSLKCNLENICLQHSKSGSKTAVLINRYDQINETVLSGADYLIISKSITNPPANVGSALDAVKLVIKEIESAFHGMVDRAQVLG